MSILDGIKDKAKKLINIVEPHTLRQTKIYDSSRNKIIVAGYTLDGVVSSTISSDTLTKQEVGIDYYYTTYYQATEQRTLTVNLLPTADCLEVIKNLALTQQTSKGWFNIAIHENDRIVNVYRGWIMELPEIGMQQDSGDRTVTFGIKTMFAGQSLIDQSTDTENTNYSKYGINPSESILKNSDVISETTGRVVMQDIPVVDETSPPAFEDDLLP